MDRVAVISDIHGNSPALQAVLGDIRRAGCSQVFVLGDIINGVDPQGCLELLGTWDNLTCLKGNAEAYVLTPNPHLLQGEQKPFHNELLQLVQWYRARLSGADLDWLQSLPDYARWNGACFAHDSPLDRFYPENWHIPGLLPEHQEWFYHAPGIFPDMMESEWQKLLAFMDMHHHSQVFCGHTHVPFLRYFGEKMVCNVGSVGLCLGGDPRPSWTLFEQIREGAYEASPRRSDYDLTAIDQLVDNALDYPSFQPTGKKEAYKKCLRTGIIWRD